MGWLFGAIGLFAALYALQSSGRVAVAEGRSWRLVPNVSRVDWPRIYPDAVLRLSAARAVVVVQVTPKRAEDGAGARVPVLVEIDARDGPSSFRGHFTTDADHPLPAPWGPASGTPIVFELADVLFLERDTP